jgi:hypothetical protein
MRHLARLIPPLLLVAIAVPASPQAGPGKQTSPNMKVVAHIPLEGPQAFDAADIDVEQELSRPYIYIARLLHYGWDVISVKDLKKPEVIYSWRIDNPDLHQGAGALRPMYFKTRGRYYFVESFSFKPTGAESELAAIAFDVTGLPDPKSVREVRRLKVPEIPGGFHNLFLYKHSDGRALMFTTLSATPKANIYDLDKFLAGDPDQGLIGSVPFPEPRPPTAWWHDFYAAYDPATHQDKLYSGGPDGGTQQGGNYVFDITDPSNPKLIVSIVGVAGQVGGHTFTPSPDGRYATVIACCQYTPMRVFDMKPALDGTTKTITRAIGAWEADWKDYPHNTEVRWPYVFVAAYEDGLNVLNLMDPTNPYSVGRYNTYDGPHGKGFSDFTTIYNGAFGLDIRNADGLIVVSDMRTGVWAIKMDGFDGWNGHQWGMPNISSAQDWDNGPEGAPKAGKVS